jgi:ABC-type polysaccharide/polyol phosphate export permease
MFTVARRLYRHRTLLFILTGRELTARYRGSVFGWAWSLVNPIVLLTVFSFVFTVVFDPRDSNVAPFGLFLVTGLFPWIWLQGSLLEGSASLLANSGLIRKATFPSELLALVPTLANLVHFLLTIPVIAIAFLVARAAGAEVSGPSAFLLPLIILIELPLIAGLSLGLAALNVHFKDVKDLLSNVLTVLFYMTPILYTLSVLDQHPWVQRVVALNPLSPFVLAYQSVLFHGVVPKPSAWLAMVAVSAIGWMLGTWVFERLRDTIVEAI